MNSQQQAQTIAGYIKAIAAAYGIKPQAMVAKNRKNGATVDDARNLLAYHLNCCGMTDLAISGFLHRTECGIQRMVHKGRTCLMDSDRELLASLPPLHISDST